MANPYFTPAELRDQDTALADAVKFPDADLESMRLLVEGAIEDACSRAFVPRQRTETHTLYVSGWVRLHQPDVRSVVSLTVDGQAASITDVRIEWSHLERVPAREGQRAEVTYTYGLDAPPLRVKRAALILAKVWLLQGPVDDRATQIAGDYGTINLATPGVFGSTFGVPEVDAVVAQYRVRQAVLA